MASTDPPRLAEIAGVLGARRRQREPAPLVLLGTGLEVSSDTPGQPAGPSITPPIPYGARARTLPSSTDLLAQSTEYWDRAPSTGETYLAELLKNEYLGTVVDFAWSNSFERALAAVVPPGRYLRMVRGEHDEAYILRALAFTSPRAKLVKLMGDIVGQSATDVLEKEMSSALRRKLVESIDQYGAIVIGKLPPTPDLADILTSSRGVIWCIGDSAPSVPVRDLRQIASAPGTEDRHVRDVCLLLANDNLQAIERENRRRMNTQVRARQPIDASYSDRLIQRLAHDIRDVCDDWADPTLLVFVHDPAAPGGSEVEKRIRRYLELPGGRGPDSVRVTVRGGSIRWVDRQAEEISESSVSRRSYIRALVIDSVSFSGRTLSLATESVRRLFPGIDVFWAALVVSKALVDSLASIGMRPDRLLSVFVSDRHDLFFPWGWTQATSSIVRRVPVHRGEHSVLVSQRPWGTIEVLTNSEPSSVRLKTIRVGEKTSYQRHALRDEFFVVLDDGLGVEFDSEDGEVVEAALLSKGDYLAVPRGVRYRLAAHRDSVRVLEIAFGLYDQTYDVERFADEYGRVGRLGDI